MGGLDPVHEGQLRQPAQPITILDVQQLNSSALTEAGIGPAARLAGPQVGGRE